MQGSVPATTSGALLVRYQVIGGGGFGWGGGVGEEGVEWGERESGGRRGRGIVKKDGGYEKAGNQVHLNSMQYASLVHSDASD